MRFQISLFPKPKKKPASNANLVPKTASWFGLTLRTAASSMPVVIRARMAV